MRNGEIETQPMQDKRITKKDDNILKIEDDIFEDEYNEITSNDIYNENQIDENLIKNQEQLLRKLMIFMLGYFAIIISEFRV
ncbi:hypothetical protein YYG_02104 [Plasmodium vinckei petteri]|uniref:Fam-b protein n=1 Tax=Plasmodium vinckei petteri TaxID=138298 RepID=W7AWY1_PLAVN|nr:hypothetical protein YYG_02104 [Plasmodium vinckei petteri]CAD2105372.1 fam-b protein [Plasmodium vinckei petteri]